MDWERGRYSGFGMNYNINIWSLNKLAIESRAEKAERRKQSGERIEVFITYLSMINTSA